MSHDLFTLGRKSSPKEIDGSTDPGMCQAPRFADVGDTEKRNAVFLQGLGHGLQSMAVGTGLDNCHHLLAVKVPYCLEVVPQGSEINLGPRAGWACGNCAHSSEARGRWEVGQTRNES